METTDIRQIEKENNLPEGYFGVCGVEIPETEYCAAAYLDFPKPRNVFADNKIQYLQTEIHALSCTLHGSSGCISDNSAYRFTLNDRKEIFKRALALGFDTSIGWFVNRAADVVRNYYNELNPTDKILSFGIMLDSEEFWKAIDQGYSCDVSYGGNSKYNNDVRDDRELDNTSFGAATYYHCVRLTNGNTVGTIKVIVDNYFTGNTTTNIYEIPRANLKDLLKNKVFSRTGYIFVFENDYNIFQNTMNVPEYAHKAVELALKNGLITTDTNVNQAINLDPAIEATLLKLKVFTVAGQPTTLARWIVALERMGILK